MPRPRSRAAAARLPAPYAAVRGLAATSSSQAAGCAQQQRRSARRERRRLLPQGDRRPLSLRAHLAARCDARRLRAHVRARRLMDDFFQNNLASMSTRDQAVVVPARIDGAPAGSSASLSSFEKAAVIREVSFAAVRAKRSSASNEDRGDGRVDHDLRARRRRHAAFLPARAADAAARSCGPAPAGATSARGADAPGGGASTGPFEELGAAPLLRQGPDQPSPRRPEKFLASFNFEGRKVGFEVTAASVQNPFKLREVDEFSCPGDCEQFSAGDRLVRQAPLRRRLPVPAPARAAS